MWTWALLPIFLSVWATLGLWIVYAMAVANGSVNVTVVFPYISTCGSYAPQSCIFAQVLNIGAILGLWISFIRYQQIRDYGCHCRLNTVSLILGMLTILGTSMVGNFQQTNQLETHLVGAFLAFFVGVAYFWLQTALTYQVKPRHGGNWIGPLRFCLCLFCTALIVMMAVFHVHNLKTVAAICEWIAAMILFFLYGLFAVDLWHLDGHSFHVQKKRLDMFHEMTSSSATLGSYCTSVRSDPPGLKREQKVGTAENGAQDGPIVL
ncbi:modulator of macroautophagy TMEM150B [Microcaecilia unicolor]|uniref:Modulator of macroautophagy TMEM150B n=1 Tax=Microcaecilia unicolor TaxID=1415580 RepID=A0A6P7XKT4_9AMPH|nr:modulator of macroautophagy TMEM150B [Microcaecilia unicolor]